MASMDETAGKQKSGSIRGKVKASFKSVKARFKGRYSKSTPVTVDNSRTVSFLSETGKDVVDSSLCTRPSFNTRLVVKMEGRLAKVDPSIFDEKPVVQRQAKLQRQGRISQGSTFVTSVTQSEAGTASTNELSGGTLRLNEAAMETFPLTEVEQGILPRYVEEEKENVFPETTVLETSELDGVVAETVPNKECQTLAEFTIESDVDTVVKAPLSGEDNALLGNIRKPLSGAKDGPFTEIPTNIVTGRDEGVIDASPNAEEAMLLGENQKVLSAASDGGQRLTETDITGTDVANVVPHQQGVSNGGIELVEENQDSPHQTKACSKQCIITEITAASDSDDLELPCNKVEVNSDSDVAPPRHNDEVNSAGQERSKSSPSNRRRGKGRRLISFVNRTVHVCAIAALTLSIVSQLKH
ncbi:hypothetical protein BSKO_01135 [Bryopsis sp. KO-2023]|nr:hypothetical protein BSKO_01135 [Bryopsis sp. KO-2023]